MEPFSDAWLRMLPILAPPLLLSLTVHEFAHARAALAFGDRTAYMQGRVSLNPLRHLDPIGTVLIFIIGFGWARPVPVVDQNLHPRRMGQVVVSLAGVTANFLLAILFIIAGLIFKRAIGNDAYSELLRALSRGPSRLMAEFGLQGMLFLMMLHVIAVNILLALFNLIPLFPLDGHHVVRELLPYNEARNYMQWQMRYGRFVLLALIFGPRLLNVEGPIGRIYGYAISTTFEIFHLM